MVTGTRGYGRASNKVHPRRTPVLGSISIRRNDDYMLNPRLLPEPPRFRLEVGLDSPAVGRVELGDVENLQGVLTFGRTNAAGSGRIGSAKLLLPPFLILSCILYVPRPANQANYDVVEQ